MSFRQSDVVTLHASGAESADANSASVHVGGYAEAIAALDVSAEVDPGSTLDIKFQTSPDGSSWYDLPTGAFAQVTGVGKYLLKLPAMFGEYARAVYDFNEGSNVKATGTLTSDATAPSNNETVTIGSRVYTFKTALTGAKAVQTLTSDATNVTDGDTVTVGAITYRFKNTMAQAYDVKIGADAATTLDNLKAAINATGTPGTEYFAGTLVHPTVSATTNTNTTQVVQALATGVAGNALVSTETSTHLSFGAATLAGGVDTIANEVLIGGSAAVALDNLKIAVNATGGTEGTEYSVGTVVHADVAATTNTNTTQVLEAKVAGIAGNAIATTETSAHLSFGAATLTGGVLNGFTFDLKLMLKS